MAEQEFQVSSKNSLNFIFKLAGFFVSVVIIYFMVIWTLELSKVNIEDLPVIKVLRKDYKIKPDNKSHSDIENLDLSINSLKEGGDVNEDKSYKIQNLIEPNLSNEEESVSLSMKESLQNSITKALKSLAQEDVISPEKIFYLYLGSFDSKKLADRKLSEIKKIDDLKYISEFSIISDLLDNGKKIYNLRSTDNFFHEKAVGFCNEIKLYKFDCKIISGLL